LEKLLIISQWIEGLNECKKFLLTPLECSLHAHVMNEEHLSRIT